MENTIYNNQLLLPYLVIVNAINAIYFYTTQVSALRDFLGTGVVFDEKMPEGFNNADWMLYKGNINHVRHYHKCVELFWLIWQGQHLTGYAFFQQPWLAKTLEVSERHVQNLIAELKKWGLIEVIKKDQNYYRVPEFFSKPPADWTKDAIEKSQKAVADFFAGKEREQKKAARKHAENAEKPISDFKSKVYRKKAKAQTPPPVATPEQQSASKEQAEAFSREMKEGYETAKLLDKTYEQEAKQPVSKELIAVVEEVAEEVAREHGKFPARDLYCQEIKAKLEKKGIKSPDWLITRTAIRWPEKRHFYSSRIWR